MVVSSIQNNLQQNTDNEGDEKMLLWYTLIPGRHPVVNHLCYLVNKQDLIYLTGYILKVSCEQISAS